MPATNNTNHTDSELGGLQVGRSKSAFVVDGLALFRLVQRGDLSISSVT